MVENDPLLANNGSIKLEFIALSAVTIQPAGRDPPWPQDQTLPSPVTPSRISPERAIPDGGLQFNDHKRANIHTLTDPGTLGLISIGLAGIGWVRRRKVA
jgi:hypothetical protein